MSYHRKISNIDQKIDIVYNKEQLKKFYSSLKWHNFKNLTLERMNELDNLVMNYKNILPKAFTYSTPSLMYRTSEILMHENNFGFQNTDELLYFYIQVVDSNLKFLELATLAQSKEEFKKMSIMQFGIYDNVITLIEAKLKIRLEELKNVQNKTR